MRTPTPRALKTNSIISVSVMINDMQVAISVWGLSKLNCGYKSPAYDAKASAIIRTVLTIISKIESNIESSLVLCFTMI